MNLEATYNEYAQARLELQAAAAVKEEKKAATDACREALITALNNVGLQSFKLKDGTSVYRQKTLRFNVPSEDKLKKVLRSLGLKREYYSERLEKTRLNQLLNQCHKHLEGTGGLLNTDEDKRANKLISAVEIELTETVGVRGGNE